MYLLALVILIITGLVSLINILFGIKDLGEGYRLLVTTSHALFALSLLFFVIKMPTKKK